MAASDPPASAGRRIKVTCEECGFKMRLEQRHPVGEVFWMVCHGCETQLEVDCEMSLVATSAPPAVAL